MKKVYNAMVATNNDTNAFHISVREFQSANSWHRHWFWDTKSGTATMSGQKSENHGFDGDMTYTVLGTFQTKKEADQLANTQKIVLQGVGATQVSTRGELIK
jgi:hypothetical protein